MKFQSLVFSKGCAILNQIMISLNELKLDLDNSTKRREQQSSICTSTETDYLSCSIINSNFNSNFNTSLSNSQLSNSFTDNQLFFEILNEQVNRRLNEFYRKLTKLIYLDLGCNVIDNAVYILDDQILENVVDLNLELQVHCTPYQINCSYRPHIGKQEKEFGEKLKKLNAVYKRRLYFENSQSSIDDHFRLLNEFEPF